MQTTKIHGVRVCRRCKGICHEHSLREKYGQRRTYYCSEQCVRIKFDGCSEEFIQMYLERFESVDCITE